MQKMHNYPLICSSVYVVRLFTRPFLPVANSSTISGAVTVNYVLGWHAYSLELAYAPCSDKYSYFKNRITDSYRTLSGERNVLWHWLGIALNNSTFNNSDFYDSRLP